MTLSQVQQALGYSLPPRPIISTHGSSGTLGLERFAYTDGEVKKQWFRFNRNVVLAGSGADANAVRAIYADVASAAGSTLGSMEVECVVVTEAFELVFKSQANDMRVYITDYSDDIPTERLAFDSEDTNVQYQDLDWPYNNGTKYYLKFAYGSRRALKLRIVTNGYFYGLILNDDLSTVFPAPVRVDDLPLSLIHVGDSFTISAGTGASYEGFGRKAAELLGYENFVLLGSGSTGFNATGTAGKMRYIDRIAPPLNRSFIVTYGFTGTGTFTIEHNALTTGAITHSSNNVTLLSNINAALATTFGSDALGRQNVQYYIHNQRHVIISRLADGFPTFAGTGVSGSVSNGGAFLGDVDEHIPREADGTTKKEFDLLVSGFSNDVDGTIADLETAVEELIDEVAIRFPTCRLFLQGFMISRISQFNTSGTGGISKYKEADAAIFTLAEAELPVVNSFVPYISTVGGVYSGYKQDDWFEGLGYVDNEDGTGSNDWATGDDGTHLSEFGQFVAGIRTAAVLSFFIAGDANV